MFNILSLGVFVYLERERLCANGIPLVGKEYDLNTLSCLLFKRKSFCNTGGCNVTKLLSSLSLAFQLQSQIQTEYSAIRQAVNPLCLSQMPPQ